MSTVCRVCLITDLRMHSIENVQLLEVFATLTGAQLKTEVGMPDRVCYICYLQLQRCSAFAIKACRSDRTLRNMIHSGIDISNNSVAPLKPKLKLKVSPIQHMSINDIQDDHIKVEIKEEMIEDSRNSKDVLRGDNLEIMQLMSPNDNINIDQVDIKIKEEFEFETMLESEQVDIKIKEIEELEFEGTMLESDRLTQLIESESDLNTTYLDWSCNICSKRFARKSLLVSHLQKHSKYSCDICNIVFSKQYQLRLHNKTHANTGFTCNICGKQKKYKCNLLIHMRVHTGEKPYNCDICGRAFRFKTSLIPHLRYHAGYRSYSCNQCKKQFVEASTLRRHMVVHTKVKPFACNQCHTMFTEAGSLRRHMRMHDVNNSTLSCDICDKSYSRMDHLKRHVLSHSSEKRYYYCNKCDKKYLEAGTLKRHIQAHHPSNK